eukprot:TRINITY_DN191011_c0_g1_i1.p2 TRINITY_DN191011_c0_g1~~TRINITY_DN191011_c0_g1_i1.p2  ORF type:complete len:108 (-),score=3.54 TRINITY_DN191011_c0_g1_i1:12-335(-)
MSIAVCCKQMPPATIARVFFLPFRVSSRTATSDIMHKMPAVNSTQDQSTRGVWFLLYPVVGADEYEDPPSSSVSANATKKTETPVETKNNAAATALNAWKRNVAANR